MDDDIFQKVSEADLPKVLKALEKDWPKHFVLHQILTVMGEYKRSGTKYEHTLYLYGDFKDGVYLNQLYLELPSAPSICFYLYTTNSDLSGMRKALTETKRIPRKDTDSCVVFTMTPRQYLPLVEEILATDSIKHQVHLNNLYWFPPDKELIVEPLPEELSMKFLDGSYAEQIDENWPLKFPGSEIMHRENLENNFGLGFYRKSDNKMVCSGLSNFSGGIFTLYTDPEVRGRGYAGLFLQRMIQELRKRGRIPFGAIIQGNLASQKVFAKTGFEFHYTGFGFVY